MELKPKPHFTALLTFISADESGRTTPVSSGYRPTIQFPFHQGECIGIQDFTEVELVFPGDTVSAEVTLLDTESTIGKIYAGLDFDFFEGETLIGSGVITKLLDYSIDDAKQ